MTYDHSFFDSFPCRLGTACDKWDSLCRAEGAEVLPMWVADMDFRCPTPVQEALERRVAHGIYGYTEQTDAALSAMLDFIQRRHGLTLSKEEQFLLPCVVTGLRAAARALVSPGDKVIVQPPVYGPFFASLEENGRVLAKNPLHKDEAGYYTMDFEGLEALCREGAKLMFLCSPHNPAGRCWTREELTRLWEILSRYGVALVSDEIHWDFVYEKDAFTSVLALPAIVENPDAPVAVLTSASKTFNLAGLQQAVLLTRNRHILSLMRQDMQNAGVVQGNLFALVATEAAYREGDAWLDGVLAYLRESQAILAKELRARLPKAILTPMEATYLAWVDLRAYGFSTEELTQRTHRAGVAFTAGTFFGEEAGEGFLRMNLACPHTQLKEALVRLERAVNA